MSAESAAALEQARTELAAGKQALEVAEPGFALANLAAGIEQCEAAERLLSQNGSAPHPQAAREAERAGAANGRAQAEVLPQSLEAEESVLGGLLAAAAYGADQAERVLEALAILTSADFARPSHGVIYAAILRLRLESNPFDPTSVIAELAQAQELERAGGPEIIVALAASQPAAPGNVPHHARIVRELALQRALMQASMVRPLDVTAIADAAHAVQRDEVTAGAVRAVDGETWLAQVTETAPAVWGSGSLVLWAEGEPLMLYGPDGVGKTSLGQQLVLHLVGARKGDLLGQPVARVQRPILYIAADRPKQARRSLKRMVQDSELGPLRDLLLVWEGPLPFSLVDNPRGLLEFANLHGAGTVFVDSLKDVALDLIKDETGARVNLAHQHLAANGIELCVLHHPRKDPAGQPEKAKTLEDVYGSRWITAGMGSVLALWGKAGDPVVQLSHLKQPAEEFGPHQILHAHDSGSTGLFEETRLEQLLGSALAGLSVADAAGLVYMTATPDRNMLEKTRRRLEKLVGGGMAERSLGESGGARYRGL